jgi:asparagine synthase (glutamine-hydrolysing)
VGALLRAEGRELLADHLRGPNARTRAYCDGAILDRVLDEHLGAKRNHEGLLWTLLNLEIWHRSRSPALA